MNKTMYEVNWHSVGDVFSHCSVTQITVIREGVLVGCTGVSITAKDSKGNKFQGSPDNYYATEEAAWAAVRVDLAESVAAHEKQLAELQVQLSAQREYLAEVLLKAATAASDTIDSTYSCAEASAVRAVVEVLRDMAAELEGDAK